MALYKEPLDAILESIKTLNSGVSLGRDEYIFGAPASIPTEASGVNTSMTITSPGVASPFAGEVSVKHIRLNLADLLILIPNEVAVSNIATTLAFALALNKFYGLLFTADDIVNEPVVLANGTGTITLTALSTSRAWVGSVTFNVVPGRQLLADVITTTKLDGLDYPDPYEAKPFGNAYSYWRNFSARYSALDILLTGESGDLSSVKDVLAYITGDAWVSTGSSRYSLEGAEITYVGETSGYPETNQNYQKVVVLKLGTACLGLAGRMFLHYNLPET
jgi:hypothetical protein